MRLPEIVDAVEKVFAELDQEIAKFQSGSTLHCPRGCGTCCFKSDIEATSLEFIPFAFHLYQQKLAGEWHEKLMETDSSICMILHPTRGGTGLCSEYQHRGLICRLFGYSARTNKYGKPELVTCQIIKTGQSDAFRVAEKKIDEGGAVPLMSHYYMQLHAIDADLSRDFFPINEAIRRAIEIVLHYYQYR